MGQSHGGLIAISIIFTVLALLFVRLRAWARQIKGIPFGIDDYLIFTAAALFVLCITVPTVIVAANSHLGDHMPPGPDGQPTPPTYAFNLVLRIFQTVHVLPIMFTKLGILFFYRRIFRGPIFSIVAWVTIALVAVWGVTFFFSILFECTPIYLSLKAPPGSPGLHCINQTANFWGLSISDVLVDLVILVIPFPFLWNLQMSTKHKLGVSSMFLLGGLTIGASIARLVVFINAGKLLAENDPDLTYYVAPTAIWVIIESSLAIISACLPVLRPIFYDQSIETILRSFASKLSLKSNNTGDSKTSNAYSNINADSSTPSINHKMGMNTSAIATPQSYAMRDGIAPVIPEGGITVQKEWGHGENTV